VGGYGSGRWGWHTAKQTVEHGLSLPTTHVRMSLNKVADGMATYVTGDLHWSIRGKRTSTISYQVRKGTQGPMVQLIYTITRGDRGKTDIDYPIEVVATTPTFGGRRWWWICPLVKNGRPCNRRVSKLYLPPGAAYFGCRHCYELTYTSCNESHKYDSLWKGIATSVNRDRGFPDGLGFDYRDVQRVMNEHMRSNRRQR
jgi:hypothetical protein